MTEQSFFCDELRDLTNVVCDGGLTENSVASLEQLLLGNAEAQQFYLKHVCLDRWLRWEFAREANQPPQQPESPAVVFLGSIVHGAVDYCSSGWPLAYLITMVIFVIGLLIGYFTPASTSSAPTQIAMQSAQQELRSVDPKKGGAELEKVITVGRITGRLDCRWKNTKAEPLSDQVVLGERFVLVSGLLEITYASGAKVLLQGPMTYEAESNGGYLSVGRLTGKLEKQVASEKPQAASNPQSSIPNPFVINTPTIVVTDLGTEFDVDVQPSGGVDVCVTRGSVETSRVARLGAAPIKERFVAGDAIRFASAAASPTRITTKARRPRPAVDATLLAVYKARQASFSSRATLWPTLTSAFGTAMESCRLKTIVEKPSRSSPISSSAVALEKTLGHEAALKHRESSARLGDPPVQPLRRISNQKPLGLLSSAFFTIAASASIASRCVSAGNRMRAEAGASRRDCSS